MNSFLRRSVPAALLAGGALLAGAGAAGAQVPLPGGGLPTGALPTGGVDSVSGASDALCNGPLAMVSDLTPVCEVAGNDNIQVGDAGRVVPRSDEGADQEEGAVNIDLQGDEEQEPCDGPGQPECEGDIDEQGPQGPDCEQCTPTTEGTTTSTTAPPSTETTVTTTPPTSVMSNTPPAEELPRTGSTVAPFVVAGAVLLLLGVGLVTATKRPALWRR
jgi:LPXTG-motif cell wall-anchored protein